MGYQIYQDLKGPAIPTSIFSKAAERGGKMGTLLDTPETARLKGEQLGKERARVEEVHRENIESTNINQENARVQGERQQEALEADKRRNKLSPIKEALGIAGSVIGVIGGVQGIMQNSEQLEASKRQNELAEIKAQTELQTKVITDETAIITADNNLAEVKRAADDLKVSSNIAEAMSKAKDNPEGLKAVLETPEAQGLFMEKPDLAIQVYSKLAASGGITAAELDEKKRIYNSQIYTKNEMEIKRLEAAAESSVRENYKKNFEALQTSDLSAILSRHVENPADIYDGEKLADFDIVPVDLYKVKDGKIKLTSEPPESVSRTSGHYLINRRTKKVLTELEDKGAEYSKILDKFHMSRRAVTAQQKKIADDGKFTVGPGGKHISKTEQPGAGKKMPTIGMGEITAKNNNLKALKKYGVDTDAVQERAQQEGRDTKTSTISDIKNAVFYVANKIAPGAIDNVSKEDKEDADKAAEALAKATAKEYAKAGPEGKRIMFDNLKFKLPSDLRDAERGGEGNFGTAAKHLEEIYFEEEGATNLKKLFKKEIINRMEAVREEGIRSGMAEKEKLSPEELEEANFKAATRSAIHPSDALKARKDYVKVTGERRDDPAIMGQMDMSGGGAVGEDSDTPATPKEVDQVTTAFQIQNNWSGSKKIRVETDVNNVEANPYLQGQPAYVKAVTAVESGGRRGQVSDTGVVGMLQVTQGAAKHMNEVNGTDLNRNIPEENVELGRMYIDYLLDEFNQNKVLAYAAYNGGPGTIRAAQKLAGGTHVTNWNLLVPELLNVIKAQYKAGVLKGNKDKMLDPWKRFAQLKEYPFKVLDYEQVFDQLS